jgi:hypothetical protein
LYLLKPEANPQYISPLLRPAHKNALSEDKIGRVNRRSFVSASVLTLLLCATGLQAAKKSKSKGPEIVLLDCLGKIEDGVFVVDGHLRNTAEKPVRKLTVVYEVLDSDKNVLTRQKGEINEDELEPGQEAGFHAQMAYHARAISFRLSFEDGGERELRSEKTGPFPIE